MVHAFDDVIFRNGRSEICPSTIYQIAMENWNTASAPSSRHQTIMMLVTYVFTNIRLISYLRDFQAPKRFDVVENNAKSVLFGNTVIDNDTCNLSSLKSRECPYTQTQAKLSRRKTTGRECYQIVKKLPSVTKTEWLSPKWWKPWLIQ